MGDRDPVVRSVLLQEYSSSSTHSTSGSYVAIPLPEDVTDLTVEDKPIEVGDQFYPRVVSSTVDGEDVSYLRYDTTDNGSRHQLNLQELTDRGRPYRVTLPKEYVREPNIVSSPFAGYEKDDKVNVEVNRQENHIRVYRVEDYQHRISELAEDDSIPRIEPVLAGGATGLEPEKEFVDLAEDTGFSGQKFRIIPFQGQHDIFIDEQVVDEADATKNRQGYVKGGPRLLNTVLDDYATLPEERKSLLTRSFQQTLTEDAYIDMEVEQISIWWDPSGGESSGHSISRDKDEMQLLFRDRNVWMVHVILPNRGSFHIETEFLGGSGETWVSEWRNSSGILPPPGIGLGDEPFDWCGHYARLEQVGEAFDIFVPTPGRPDLIPEIYRDEAIVHWFYD